MVCTHRLSRAVPVPSNDQLGSSPQKVGRLALWMRRLVEYQRGRSVSKRTAAGRRRGRATIPRGAMLVWSSACVTGLACWTVITRSDVGVSADSVAVARLANGVQKRAQDDQSAKHNWTTDASPDLSSAGARSKRFVGEGCTLQQSHRTIAGGSCWQ